MKRILFAFLLLFCFSCFSYSVTDSYPDITTDSKNIPRSTPMGLYNSRYWRAINVDNLGRIVIAPYSISNTGFIMRDSRFENKVSSGTSGLLTGVTTGVITITDNVISWSFLIENINNTSTYGVIVPSIWGTNISLRSGQSDTEYVDIPAPVTFTYSIPITSTMTYTIRTLK